MPEYFEHTPKSLVPGIQVHGLKKQFGEITAIDHLSVTMYKNETFCLLGKNGAGKSTLVSILTGMHWISKIINLIEKNQSLINAIS